MTTTDDRPAFTCPSWCGNGTNPDHPCNGEHYSDSQLVSATAGRPPTVDFEQGARFPTIGVAAVFSQHPNSTDAAPYISLSIPQRTYDVDLRLNEAEELVQQLQGHIALVRGG